MDRMSLLNMSDVSTNNKCQTIIRAQDVNEVIHEKVNEVNYVVPFLPVSSSLAAGFEEVEKSLRTLQFKLDYLAEKEIEKDGEDSSVTRILAKALRTNPQKEETKSIIPTTISKMSLSDDGITNKETSFFTTSEGKEEKVTASLCKSNVVIINGKKKLKPFIAGSRIPQRLWSSDTLLVPVAPIHKDMRREAYHSSTKSSEQSEDRSPIAPVLSNQNSFSNLSTSLTSLLSNRANEEMDSVANKLSFTTSDSEFEPTLQLPLDLSSNVLHDDEERLIFEPIRNFVKREVKYRLDEVKQIERKRFDSSEVNTTSLSTPSPKTSSLILQPHVSNLSTADSFIMASVCRINLPMSSIKAQVSLQQSRRLVFESLGQLSEIEENSFSSNKRILGAGDLPLVSEVLSSTNASVMTTNTTFAPLPVALCSSLLPISRPSSLYDSQQSLSLKRSIAASLSFLPTQSELLRVEGRLKRDRLYGDLVDEIHAKEMLFSLRQSSRETSESSSFAKMSNDETERAELNQETTPQAMESAYNENLSTLNLSSKHFHPDCFIPSAPIYTKVDNTRTEALLSRSNAILHHDHQQHKMPLREGTDNILNAQRIKRELEKWLYRPPLLEQPNSDKIDHNLNVSLNKASQIDPPTSAARNTLSVDRESINAPSSLEAINFLDLVGSESVGTQDQSLPSSICDDRSRRGGGGAREGSGRGRRESVSTSFNSQPLDNRPQRLSRKPWRFSRFGEWDASKWTDLLDRGGVRKIVHQ